MILQLSKHIRARTKTAEFLWCKKDFMKMDKTWRDARARIHRPLNNCFWCDHEFLDGEMMALACCVGKGNKMLCQDCASELLASDQIAAEKARQP
jgi:hypothetical protein